MKSFFRFAGGLSLDYGIVIEEYPEYHTAQRVIETQTVPGRNGNLIFDTGAYGNVEQEYTVYLKAKPNTLHQAARRAAIWLQSPRGYQVLEDSYDPEVFRKAVFSGPLELSNWFERYGRATLTFDCLPQRWHKSGQIAQAITSGDVLYNPGEVALPEIEITGSGAGEIIVGSSTVSISSIPAAGLTIDCDTQDAYSGTENANGLLTISGGFPALQPGANQVSFNGGITAVNLTPRWWSL